MTFRTCGKGRTAYLSGFTYSPEAAAMLMRLLVQLTGIREEGIASADSMLAEAAWFPKNRTLVVLNNSDQKLKTEVNYPEGKVTVELKPLEMRFIR